MYNLFLVFLGGGLGSLARYGLAIGLKPYQTHFPWATLAANALACLVLGFLVVTQSKGLLSERERLLWATGFCGGFSTFSTFIADSWQPFQGGDPFKTWLNIVLNLSICWAFFWAGTKL